MTLARAIRQETADRALAGTRLDVDELRDALEADVLALGTLADEVRRRMLPAVVLYRRVHAIPCDELGGGAPIPAEAAEIRLTGLPVTPDHAARCVEAARRLAGSRPLRAFAWRDLIESAEQAGASLEDVLRRLAHAGMTDVDELAADDIGDVARAIATIRSCGLQGTRIVVARPTGDRLPAILDAVRGAQEADGGLTSIAPLPRHPAADRPTTGYDDIRAIALTRLALAHLRGQGEAMGVEVDWQQYGPKLAQVALIFGADRLDNVPAGQDEAVGRRRGAVEEVERNIRAAGFEPAESGRSPVG